MSNPVFDRISKDVQQGRVITAADQRSTYGQPGTMSSEQLQDMYNAPAAGPVHRGTVTYDDVMMKSMGLFGLMLVTAAIAWFTIPYSPGMYMPMLALGGFGGLAVGLLIAFKKTISVPLIVAYAALEGLLVGAFSAGANLMFGDKGPIVQQAIIATVCVCAVVFFGYRTGVIRVTAKSRRIFMFALGGYMLFALVNVIASWVFRANEGWGIFAAGSGMGILVSALAVGLAAYALAVDLDDIDNGVAAQLPEKYSWLLAHGLIVTVVWMYISILRLLMHFYSND